jgi:tetratricopeptide (TPR) repeat protein
MRFEEQFASALAVLKEDSQRPRDETPSEEAAAKRKQAIGEVCSSYWTWFADSLGEIIRANGDTTPFINENADLIDFGIHEQLVSAAEKKAAIVDCEMEGCRIQVRTVSQWLKELLQKVRQGDKMEKLSHDHKLQQIQQRKLMKEIADLQTERRAKIEDMYFKPTDPAKSLAELESADGMLLESLRKKREISKGAFLSVDQKRLHVKQQIDLQKKLEFANTFIATLPSKEGSAEVKRLTKTLHEDLFNKVVDAESVMKRMADELEAMQKKSDEMPASEVENRISEELEYIRDLTRLSAKRLSLDPFPLLKPEDKVFALSALNKSLNQISEFDPRIFKNDRVPLFGRPYVFIVPGTGNAIYDWKNNCIILPTIAPGGNFMGSLATGIIEYRLDVDEDKALLNSFNELPDMKTIRSIIDLKAKLVKNYIIWMTSEYNGYRILSKDLKKWFEYEIGPPKNDIFTPLEFQSYTMTSMEFHKLFDEVAARLKSAEDRGAEPDPSDLWAGSLMYYEQGKPERALPLIEKYVKVKPDDLMGWYNLGHMAMKQMNRTLARDAFNAFCKMDTQSWWSKVARDHLRNLGT